jgi:predicted MFS family arabinose efflux permease
MSALVKEQWATASSARAWYGLALLSLVSFFNYLDRMVIAVLVEPMKRDLQLSDLQVGLVSGLAFALLYATAGIPIARIADKKSRVTLLAICLTVWSGMTALTGAARNFIELFLVRMGVGVGEAGCVPAAHSLIGDLFPPERRAFAIGLFQAGGLMGLSVGLTAAGYLAETWGWRFALLVVGLAGLPLAALVAFSMREPARSVSTVTTASESALVAVKALMARPALVHLVLGISIGAFATYGMATWIPAFYVRSHGLSLTEVGFYGALAGGLAGVLGTVVGGIVMIALRPRDARWELWLPLACYALTMPLFAAMALVPSTMAAFLLQATATIVAAAGGTVALSAMQTFAEPHRRATAIAIMLMLSSLIGLGLGPVAVGQASDMLAAVAGRDSLRFALAGSSALLLWAGLHFWLASRHAARDAATVEA